MGTPSNTSREFALARPHLPGPGSNRFAFLQAFGTTGFRRQVLACIAWVIKIKRTAPIAQIAFEIHVFQTFDNIGAVFIFEMQNADQN